MEETRGECGKRKWDLSCPSARPKKRLLQRSDSDTSTDSAVDQEDPVTIDPTHDEQDEERTRVRKEMVARIEERLDNDASSRASLARALERNLYNNAPSFEVYADVTTLDQRIRLAAVAYVTLRRLRKFHKGERRKILEEALGTPKYEQVCDLVKAVQDLRIRGAASCRCTCCRKPKFVLPGGQRVMAPAVRNLFFDTQLIEATECIPVDQIPTLEWDTMIQQAKDNIEAFQEWSGLRTPHYNKRPCAKCA